MARFEIRRWIICPCLALLAFGIAVFSVLSGTICKFHVDHILHHAIFREAREAHGALSAYDWMGIGFALVIVVDVLSLAAIVMARLDMFFRQWKLECICFHYMARPGGLYILWCLCLVTLLGQLVLVPIHSCNFTLLLLLRNLCEDASEVCKENFASELQPEFPALDTMEYCSQNLDGSGPASGLVVSLFLTVISQAMMMSALSREWERVNEELHYNEHLNEEHDEASYRLDQEHHGVPLDPHGDSGAKVTLHA